MISTNEFHNGLTIELSGTVFQVVEFQHSKTGRGGAFVRAKLRDLENGGVIEKTFRAGEKVNRAHVEQCQKQFLYRSNQDFIFMDNETYEQIVINEEQLGDKINYLKENMTLSVLMYKERPIDITLPTSVQLKVIETQPGIKGNTVSGGSKPAKLESGAVVQVPLFIEEGDLIRVDTRSGEYLERV
ncbi:MAG: elongation factor P [Halanaerobiales bacterium]|nr:elongation factor P [Halanaerobiales bacterium]